MKLLTLPAVTKLKVIMKMKEMRTLEIMRSSSKPVMRKNKKLQV